jgi:hypothetical protein
MTLRNRRSVAARKISNHIVYLACKAVFSLSDAIDGSIIRGVLKQSEQPKPDIDDAVRVRRLREDAERSMSTNLTEGIALSHLLARFVGIASRG